MKSLQDALYNWLTIKVVVDARPDDLAAKETLDFFDGMLSTEHEVSNIDIITDDVMYYLSYQQGEETKKARYPRELIEIMLDQINKEPEKYEDYPIEN
ncbi:hypothetical protein BABA_19636 [Neobacillus bataviensis LMG 21833]|uniref:Uncharacterized protein n=1 Tax=Neobacillus bataviensis LMG 21833 TaxID=1117379 RepID=K6DBV3_9BACI|nr:hypothetical protein [Neobacillus bataviensis]EKN65533.1 hypothetical protein BABA_19636 [Neobacillus bataviensis LMG 21833]